MIPELPVEQYFAICDLQEIGLSTSAEAAALKAIIGQERAVTALQFGLGIKEKGFNIFVAGLPGTGRTTAIENYLAEVANQESVPSDWCYVNDFHDNYRPNALRLPPGTAEKLRTDMQSLVAAAISDIRSALESEMAATQRDQLVNTYQLQKQALLEKVNEQARQESFAIQSTPVGLMVVPVAKGKLLTEEEFVGLNPEQREELSKKQQQLQTALEAAVRQAKLVDKAAKEALQNADRQVALYAIRDRFDEMKTQYNGVEEIPEFLSQVQEDMLASLSEYTSQEDAQPSGVTLPIPVGRKIPGRKYAVNVLVDHTGLQGAPVVLERNPTYGNLFGRIEQEAQFGALVTDFTMIRSGSLHRANGGYLVLPAEEVLRNPLAWESLKRALVNNEIVIEDAGDKMGFMTTKNLRPEPIPLRVKVILVGRSDVYQLLLAYDEHFNELFKVKADFDTQMPRTPENTRNYASFVARICQKESLCHMDALALARIIEHGSRLAEDQQKLTTRFGEIADVIREANYYAGLEQASAISASHVLKAVEARHYRSALYQERVTEMIQRGIIKIDVSGTQVGQVNGLSVLQLGDIAFGQPNRITASVGLGREGLVDIEREANLGGPIHTKGMLILAGFLAEQFSQDKPLSLTARLVFEQNYSGVEGDSASSTELYALLSALSDLPVHQDIAVTGSVNQKGEVQAIGGVNFKIEGFFEICKSVGLNGKQGVIIPASNQANLMLKDEVVRAARDGLFHIWPVKTIAEGIEVLTGVPAGERQADGKFTPNSVFARVDQRLNEFAETWMRYTR
jgi:lon-related putative ATP-dependent protease